MSRSRDLQEHAGHTYEDMWDSPDHDPDYAEDRETKCNRCNSTDVRWRQQGGKWVLFSLQPGKLHICPVSTDGFEAVPE